MDRNSVKCQNMVFFDEISWNLALFSRILVVYTVWAIYTTLPYGWLRGSEGRQNINVSVCALTLGLVCSRISAARMHYSYRNSAILVSNFFRNFLEISDFFQNRGLAFFWNQGNIGTFDENWTSVIQAVFRNTRWWCKSAWNKAGWILKIYFLDEFCVRVPLKQENWISEGNEMSPNWQKHWISEFATICVRAAQNLVKITEPVVLRLFVSELHQKPMEITETVI